ncbi:phosphoglycolate phosphatase [Maritimibacter sp. 55A14]|uniref:phosphoglycolate phosphatase n=1 Tax=Maritimibacter sp. 55A14 TaxID=2174844 RepID=UPI000D60925D|nr:phosphoglycolate phosphatase [Maritimibacter sp. 55A14]PWE31178.1 phosphoglycolate phosphatase [Maritimibacter sp. 55A14]
MSLPIIFDLDGTLIDSAPDIHGVGNAVLAEEGLPPLTFAEARSFIGNGAGAFVSRMMAARGISEAPENHTRLTKAFIARYEGAVQLTRLYPGVEAALDELRAAGHPLGLCTNKPHAPTLSVLRHFGLDAFFATVVGGDTLVVRKPDPAPLRHAMTGLKARACLFVGDSEIDAETAQAAGAPFALFTEGYRKGPVAGIPHSALFAEFSDLPAIAAAL